MKLINSVALAGVLALGLGTAAHAQSAQVPNFANPYPANPVATDGSPLPRGDNTYGLQTGRSAYVGGPLGLVDGVVGAGVDTARGAVDAGFGTAGAVVNGGLATADGIVR